MVNELELVSARGVHCDRHGTSITDLVETQIKPAFASKASLISHPHEHTSNVRIYDSDENSVAPLSLRGIERQISCCLVRSDHMMEDQM